eukprot:TCALIF_13161-PA protein Name:"Protein of unknown function" AED:0.00 eAED:0.00 QI:80/1/0.5/1/0/0/2/27/39
MIPSTRSRVSMTTIMRTEFGTGDASLLDTNLNLVRGQVM